MSVATEKRIVGAHLKTSGARSAQYLQLVILSIAVIAPDMAFAQQRLGAPPGKGSYMRYCASCHGEDGKGDGPLASLLKQKPADLTQLAKKNNGVFPVPRVEDIMDGRVEVAAHGPSDMPVWGHRFGAAEEAAGGNAAPTVARERMDLIIRYLNSIQEK
jgi:mono/diheme cytochrome c family protein